MATLEEVAVALYAVAPAEFTAARTACVQQARADKDRDLAVAVGRLPKPTVAAWAVNILVRSHPDEVGRLLTLGSRLVEAQAALAGQELRELDRQRHQVMAGVVRLAKGLAAQTGPRLTDAVALQVEGTLRAAMSDPDAARAVLTGLLTTHLTSTGLEAVDVTGAVAVPDAHPLPDAPARPTPLRAVAFAAAEPKPAKEPGSGPRKVGKVIVEPPGGTRRSAPSPVAARDEAARVETARKAAAREAAAREEAVRKEAAREDERRRRRADAARDVELADQAARDAAVTHEQAVAVADGLAGTHEELTTQIRDLGEQVKDLTAQLHRLRALEPAAAKDARHARARLEPARRAADAARRRADAARARLDELEQQGGGPP